MGIPLLRGRMLDENLDTLTSAHVVVVNKAFVEKFFSRDEDPIGARLEGREVTIVGVVGPIRQDITEPPMAEIDFPISQIPIRDMMTELGSMQLVVRSAGETEPVVSSLRHALHDVDPALPFRQPLTMGDIISDVLVFERLENWLFGTFAAFAALLAIVGLYALISHEVELSTHDIGVRMALGSTPMSVLAAVYRRVALMLFTGVAVGLLLAGAAQKLVASMVVIHAAKDVPVIAALAAGMLTVGLLAVLLPAKRAASVDPMVALRYE